MLFSCKIRETIIGFFDKTYHALRDEICKQVPFFKPQNKVYDQDEDFTACMY